MLTDRNQSLAKEVDNLGGALHAAQSSDKFVQNPSKAHIASLSIKGQPAVDEIETLTARRHLMK